MTSDDVLAIKIDTGYVSSIRASNSKLQYTNTIVLQINNFAEKYFFVYYSEYAALPGLQRDPALILLGTKESTTVTSHKSCLPTAHGTSFKPSGRF